MDKSMGLLERGYTLFTDSRGVLTAFREGLDYEIDSVFVVMADNTLSFKQRFRTNHSF